jgi:hypothetical protein
MSAFMCSDEHTSALVNAAVEYGIAGFPPGTPPGDPHALERFALLVEENGASLLARYGEKAHYMIGDAHHYRPGPALPVLHVLKLARSYEYQSCEHDGWDTSRAKRWIDTLIGDLIHRLPGYENAPWSI